MICPVCNGNDKNTPCAYPGDGQPMCLRDQRLKLEREQAAPRKGDEITYKGDPVGVVLSVDGGLCWVEYYDGSPSGPFIWRFKDGLNRLHDWPRKYLSVGLDTL
jgi:hypothetical protein